MDLGTQFEQDMKEKSEQLQIPFSNLLRGYVMEEILKLIYESEYADHFWLSNPWVLGAKAYESNQTQNLVFYYLENEKDIPETQLIPGQKLSWKMASYMIAMIFRKDRSKYISWKGRAIETESRYQWNLIGAINDMQIPLVVRLIPFVGAKPIPEKRQLSLLREEEGTIDYLCFSTEHLLCQHVFQIISKLELISSMESYDIVDKVLQNQPVSGRYMMEELETMVAKDQKVLKYKRMEQLAAYQDYTYMKKRWIKYQKSKNLPLTEWSEVMERFLKFAAPIWKSMCNNEIFLEDWMPELGRYLA